MQLLQILRAVCVCFEKIRSQHNALETEQSHQFYAQRAGNEKRNLAQVVVLEFANPELLLDFHLFISNSKIALVLS